ncbi:hypothetical protein TNCV_2860361 [Trichonephila clavipes]|nr:hypothetical protein TNCV_2860361 [Trichonephila clavipes]
MATGSYMTPIYSRSQKVVEELLHKYDDTAPGKRPPTVDNLSLLLNDILYPIFVLKNVSLQDTAMFVVQKKMQMGKNMEGNTILV